MIGHLYYQFFSALTELFYSVTNRAMANLLAWVLATFDYKGRSLVSKGDPLWLKIWGARNRLLAIKYLSEGLAVWAELYCSNDGINDREALSLQVGVFEYLREDGEVRQLITGAFSGIPDEEVHLFRMEDRAFETAKFKFRKMIEQRLTQ